MEENGGFKELERLFADFDEALRDNNPERASAAMNSIWMLFHLLITPITHPDLKELNYFKVPIDMSNGGRYLLQLTHVSGPKIKFDEDVEAMMVVKAKDVV